MRVYFLNDNQARGFPDAETVLVAFEVGDMELMAEVEGDDPEHAYKLMQNGVVTDSWMMNPPDGLKVLSPPVVHLGRLYGRRSMNVGDVVLTNDGRRFFCAAIGFEELV